MSLKHPQALAELADLEAIRDCLYRYSRGVDRCDEEVLRSVYWQDAFDDHCVFQGTREELIAWVLPLLKEREATSHNIDNILIRLHGEHADVESYFQGYHVMRGEGKPTASLQGGRYLDRFEKRGEEWRIIGRICVHGGTHSEAIDVMQIDAHKFRQGDFDRPSSLRPVGRERI